MFCPLEAPAKLVSLVLDADDAARKPANLIFLNGSSLTTCIKDGSIGSVFDVVLLVKELSLLEIDAEWEDRFWSGLFILGDVWLVLISLALSSLTDNNVWIPPETIEGVETFIFFPSVSTFWCKPCASGFLGSCFWDSSEIIPKLVDSFLVLLGSVLGWGEVLGSALAGTLSGGNVGVCRECCPGLVSFTSLVLVNVSIALSLGVWSLLECCDDMGSELALLVLSLLYIFSSVIGGFSLKYNEFLSYFYI